jgi:hypothetical protein
MTNNRAHGRVSNNIRLKVFQRDDFICKYCGTRGTAETLAIDHMMPVVLGGTSELENLVTACLYCNRMKGAKELSDYLQDVVSKNTQFYKNFQESLTSIESLIQINLDDANLQTTLNRLLFANIVTSMETYLSDAFINTVSENSVYTRKFMETTPAFNEKKYKLSDIYTWLEDTKLAVRQYLTDIVYHNIFIVRNMYKCTLDIDFPDDMETIRKAVMLRHDIVHRNGKTKIGEFVAVNNEDIVRNISVIKDFITYIDKQLQEKVKHNRSQGY